MFSSTLFRRHGSLFRFRTWGAPVFVLIATILASAPAAAQSHEEARAIFLYNFAKFVEWPADTFEDAATPVTIAIVGSDAIARALERYVRGKNAHGRDLAVKALSSATGCAASHIVFVGDSRLIPDVLAAIGTKPILSVADDEDFLRSGGAIRLFTDDGKVRCAINVKVTDAARLKLSEKLVKASS